MFVVAPMPKAASPVIETISLPNEVLELEHYLNSIDDQVLVLRLIKKQIDDVKEIRQILAEA